ncbi:hypothetical protein HRbin27_01584 [bacterium HR27]|nr:hypothetical protein HRbin27_01584 [bacterium HR27]
MGEMEQRVAEDKHEQCGDDEQLARLADPIDEMHSARLVPTDLSAMNAGGEVAR